VDKWLNYDKDLKLHKLAKFSISGRNSNSELKDRNPIATKSLSQCTVPAV